MKNFKFWGLILVSAMCAGLTACGGDDESSSSSSNGGNTIENRSDGSYRMIEVSAPAGYKLAQNITLT